MRKELQYLMFFTAIGFMPIMASKAETVTTNTEIQQVPPMPGKRLVNFTDFDLNRDSILSSFEVGEMLFKLFDLDASASLDSIEYDLKSVITVVPMEKETIVTYDYNNDGIADTTQYTFQTFTQDTQLARLDKNKDGLSPQEFIERSFLDMDGNKNNSIELAEWRNSYISRINPTPIPIQ